MARAGKYDAALIGAAMGLLATTPTIASWCANFLNSWVPFEWYVFGSSSLSIFGVIIGAILGFIAEKTR